MSIKTKKAFSKRIRLTATGKIRRVKSGGSHLKIRKSLNQKRRLKKNVVKDVSNSIFKKIKSSLK